jgi:hypothetical protein
MRLSMRGLMVTCSLLWGGALLFVGLLNLAVPAYGLRFLQMMSSVYPWFHASHSFGDVLIGTLDGLVDGAVGGLFFAWLYNRFVASAAQGSSRTPSPVASK